MGAIFLLLRYAQSAERARPGSEMRHACLLSINILIQGTNSHRYGNTGFGILNHNGAA